jgi:class 3 adenylate cyclase
MNNAFENDESRTFALLRRTKSGGLTGEQLGQLKVAKYDATGRQASILVVDDSNPLRTVVVLTLRALGYESVYEAADGQEALDLLAKREFDLMILDVEMPRVDGFGVLAALKRDPHRRHMPVIVASGLDQLEAVVKCIELGADDFLPKPVNSVILNARIGSSLDRKRLRDLERLRLVELEEEKKLLNIEKEKSERLLLNILPRAIAERLKNGEHTIADRYSDVTVLFADLMDFTILATTIDPVDLVGLLNDLFSRFDQLADRHGLEKIKTIGDSYLVVGGLPEPKPDHAEAVAEMALGMLDAMADINRERGTSLCLRIGMNSGPVVAGVIGHKKFTYDLWGSAVNLASRMQSLGLANRIHLPPDTYQLLRDKFEFTERGTIFCKGMGDITTYLLDRKKS